MVKRLGGKTFKSDPLTAAIGQTTVLDEHAGEGTVESIAIAAVRTSQHNPRTTGRISPAEIIEHRDGKIDLTKNKDPERRKFFQGISELSQSISRSGLLQPIVVLREIGRDPETGRSEQLFRIAAGERRFLAHLLLDRKQIRAVIRPMGKDVLFERAATIVENIQRHDLTFKEMMLAIQTLDALFQEANGQPIGRDDLQRELGLGERACQRYLKIVRAPEDVLAAVVADKLRTVEAAVKATGLADASERAAYIQNQFALSAGDTAGEGRIKPKARATATKKRGPGRKRRYVDLGKTAHPVVVRGIIEKCLGKEAFNRGYGDVDWAPDDLASAQAAWDRFLTELGGQ